MTNAPPLPDPEVFVWTRDGMYCPREKPVPQAAAWIRFKHYDTLRDQLAEAQREIERFKARCIELELDIIDAQTVRDNSLKILGQQVERAETAEQQLAAETARADANEKDARRLDWLQENYSVHEVADYADTTALATWSFRTPLIASWAPIRDRIDAALAKS